MAVNPNPDKGFIWVKYHGNEEECQKYFPLARNELGNLSNYHAEGTEVMFRTIQRPGGVLIRVWSGHGINRIDIWQKAVVSTIHWKRS